MNLNFISDMKCWQDMERPDKIDKLLNDDFLSDCTFLVGPDESTAETISGHKLMFALESPVFEAMLFGNFAEAKNNDKIPIDDVLPQDFKNFRSVLYHNDCEKYSMFSFEEIFDLHRIANKYLVSSICKKCVAFLKSSITKTLSFDRLIVLFEYASTMEDKSLQTTVQKEICQRDVNTILNEKIHELPAQLFYNYILFVSKMPNPPTPISIFKAIQLYFHRNHLSGNKVAYNAANKKMSTEKDAKDNNQICTIEDKDITNMNGLEKYTEKDAKEPEEVNDISVLKNNLFKLVEFHKMTPKEFIDGPGKSNLLGIQQKYDWLKSLSVNYTTTTTTANSQHYRAY